MAISRTLGKISQEPFLELVAEASEIHIEELPGGNCRQFYVALRPPKPAPSPVALEKELESKPKEYFLTHAGVLLQNKEYILARNLYSYVLKSDIRNEVALKGLGTCLSRLGEAPAARRCFKALWELYGKEDSLLWMALTCVAEKDDASALSYFKQITSPHFMHSGDQFDFYREFGNAQTRSGDYTSAETLYRKALDIEPSSETVHINLGMLEIQRKRYESAGSYFHRALRINPKSSRAHCGNGIVLAELGDERRAKDALWESLNLDSQNVVAIYELLALCNSKDEVTQLRRQLRKYLDREPKHREIRYALAALFFRENEWNHCEVELDEILRAEPGHLKAQKLKVELLATRHRN